MDEDEYEITQEDKELMEKIEGFHFWYRDVTYSIFENGSTFPSSISFLIKIPCSNAEYGAIIVTNPYKGTYLKRACKNRNILNAAYSISKRKILTRSEVKLGWEGKMINESKYS